MQMVIAMLTCAVLSQAPKTESLGPMETVYIPHFNAYCEGQKVLDGPKAGEYVVRTVLQSPTVPTSTPTATTSPPSGDPYGFMNWLNGVRASYGLRPVRYDQNLSNWAAVNNSQQLVQGLGHHVMGPARRQNSAMGGGFPGDMWMASGGHRAALLDPTISWFGIAAAGAYWTWNAY